MVHSAFATFNYIDIKERTHYRCLILIHGKNTCYNIKYFIIVVQHLPYIYIYIYIYICIIYLYATIY